MHDSCFGVTVKECVSFVGAVLKGGNHKLCPHFSKVDVVSWESSLLVFLL